MKHTDGSQNNEVALRDTNFSLKDYPMDSSKNDFWDNLEYNRAMNYYCYKITHIPTGRYYIGKRIMPPNLSDWTQDEYYGSGTLWKRIYKSHPPEEFVKECLAQFDSKEKMNWAEVMLVGELWQCDPLCKNLRGGGEGGGIPGSKHADETKAKISATKKGRISNRKGVTLSDETKAKLSAAFKGKPQSEEARAKKIGKNRSDTTKAKTSEAVKAWWAKRKARGE